MQIGFFGLLAILFIGLKLTGMVAWSWWFVLAPLWAPATVVFVSIAGIFAGALLADRVLNRRRLRARGW